MHGRILVAEHVCHMVKILAAAPEPRPSPVSTMHIATDPALQGIKRL